MIGKTLSHFRIEAKLGQGGMGEVYRARDEHLDRDVALKVLPADTFTDESARKRFRKEALALSKLNHPNIATIYDFDTQDGVDFLVMEYVRGTTLSERVSKGALPEKEIARLGGQVAEALEEAHEQGIIHRDLKPANVMVTAKGRAKVLDFGIAKLLRPEGETTIDGTATETRGVPGTLPYMAPEQMKAEAVDGRTDLYALGALLYQTSTGRRPFPQREAPQLIAAILHAAPASPRSINSRVSPELERIILKCLEKDPKRRPQTAQELRADLDRLILEKDPAARLAAWRRRPAAWMAAGVVLAALAAGGWALVRQWRVSWAETQALPEITRLTEAGELYEAYVLARQAERYLPEDERLQQVINRITLPLSVVTEPAGAQVFVKGFSTPEAPWELLGETPLEQVTIPYALMRWRIVKEGFETFEGAPFGKPSLKALAALRLDPLGSRPPGMVRVPGGPFLRFSLPMVQFGDYWLDRFEVTNREYKAFVRAGGYQTREYWRGPFVDETGELSWDEATARFRDATGRPGPATWELGTYPEGHDEYPVSSISWYEAAAYCAYAGKRLPTAVHWFKALGHEQFSDMLHLSNFGDGPVSVGSLGGLGAYGTYDMAGNVKEWAWNATTDGHRYILGAAWGEPTYMVQNLDARRPFDRAAAHGVRCARYEDLPPATLADIPFPAPEFVRLEAVGDEVFEAYRRMYAYDRSELNAAVEAVDDQSPHWRKEVVSFDAAYGGERVTALLFLPRDVAPPYQAVIFFPGLDASFFRSSERLASEFLFDFIPRSGRALVYPIYKGMYERYVPSPRAPNEMRDRAVQWSRDLGRTIDYLETRADIDHRKLAYYGFSLGGLLGPVFTAVDRRFAASVLVGAAICLREATEQPVPEMSTVNFAPRSTVPTLMINGRDDLFVSAPQAQQPLFDLLGAPGENKRHAVLEGGHIPSDRSGMIREVLDWLDRFLGPVQ